MMMCVPMIPPVVVPLRLIDRVAVPSAKKVVSAPALRAIYAEPSKKVLASAVIILTKLDPVAVAARKKVYDVPRLFAVLGSWPGPDEAGLAVAFSTGSVIVVPLVAGVTLMALPV